jgi:hypothetical protein
MLEWYLIKDRGLISTVYLKRARGGTKQRYETAASGCNAEKGGKKLLWKFGVGQQYSKRKSPFFLALNPARFCGTSCPQHGPMPDTGVSRLVIFTRAGKSDRGGRCIECKVLE